jgi:hypothetical protein
VIARFPLASGAPTMMKGECFDHRNHVDNVRELVRRKTRVRMRHRVYRTTSSWPPIGVAAGIGLVLYFVGAIVSHLRVGDVKGIGSAAFMLVLAAGALTLRVLLLST